jgi:hypothetical protein
MSLITSPQTNRNLLVAKLPAFLRLLLNSCPRRPKRGIHPWLYRVSRQLHWHFSEREIFELLRDRTQNVGRVVTDREIITQIRSARLTAWPPRSGGKANQ